MSPLKIDPKESLPDQHTRLLVENNHYLALVRKQKEHFTCMDSKMKEMQARIWEKKKKMGGRICTMRRPQHQRKHIRIMDDRVHQATTRFDKLLSQNQALRDDIDHLLRQRGTFASVYHQLNKEMDQQHSIMEELVEKSVLAYDQRSEALARMLSVKERSKKDAALCHTEMTELRRVIDHEIKLRSFMVKKSQESVPVIEDEESKKRKAEQAQRERMGGESQETYQAVHRHIVAIAGERNLRKVGKKFAQNEEKSFAYFNYINELNNKSTMLQDRINKLRNDIVHFELQNKEFDEQWQGQLKELEGELELKRCYANALEAQFTLACKALDQQKNAISDLFLKMKCDPSPITGKLGCSAEVTDDNVTQFIGILEEQVHELLMVLVMSTFKVAEEMELPPQNLLLASCSLMPAVLPSATQGITAATFEDAATDVLLGQGSEKPLDYKALCERVLPRVLQTEQGKAPRAPSAPQRGKKKFNPKSA